MKKSRYAKEPISSILKQQPKMEAFLALATNSGSIIPFKPRSCQKRCPNNCGWSGSS